MDESSFITATVRHRRLLSRYVFSTDHKVVGLQYFFLSLVAALSGTLLSLLMRIHLIWPNLALPLFGAIKPENYLAYLTMHGTLMVFFVLSLVPQSGFGNYFLPLQLGVSEMSFPKLNAAGFWISLLSFLILLAAFFAPGGAPGAGWTQYPPLSAIAASGWRWWTRMHSSVSSQPTGSVPIRPIPLRKPP